MGEYEQSDNATQIQLASLREQLKKVNERLDTYGITAPGDDLWHDLLDKRAELQDAIWLLED